ncbi:MAG: MerC domain-containing protein [Pseudomonadota bacterium]
MRNSDRPTTRLAAVKPDLPPQERSPGRRRDLAGMAISGLCALHCLSLAALAVMLPALVVNLEAEWIHVAFVVLALPLGIDLIRVSLRTPERRSVAVQGLAGLSLLLAALLVHPLHEVEEPVTIVGALLLATAHWRRWAGDRRASTGIPAAT